MTEIFIGFILLPLRVNSNRNRYNIVVIKRIKEVCKGWNPNRHRYTIE